MPNTKAVKLQYYHGLPQVSSLFLLHLCLLPRTAPPSDHDKKHTAGYTVTGGNKKQVHSLHFPLSSVGSATKASSLVVRVCKGCFCRGSSVRRLLEMGHR